MKRCPRCGQTYTDSDINFCLNDGELLSRLSDEPPTLFKDDAPPTVMMDRSRVTNQTNWQTAAPPAIYQSPQQPVSPGFGTLNRFAKSTDQTLPTIAFALGLASLVLVCCYGGIWLGLPAAIVGFLGLRNADSDPERYGGRGLAIGGMVLGIVTFLMSIVFIIFAALA